jgi:two-component system, response regulator PdtaR
MADSSIKRALIAEDEGMTVMLLRRALTAAGYQVVGAVSNGEQAVRQAEELSPDFILMDVNMPGINGIEATRRIVERRPIPIIVLTAYSDESLVEEAIEAGACAYIVKPITSEQVVPAVRTALARFETMEKVRQENDDLKDALETRKLVERAKGILMQRMQLAEPDAFKRLQKISRDKGQTMKQTAQEVLQADTLFQSL